MLEFYKRRQKMGRTYDFETAPSRRGVGAAKWEGMYNAAKVPLSDDIIPFSVADMELHNPPEIVEGLKKHLESMVLGYTMPTDSYFDAVIRYMQKWHSWNIDRDWIVPFSGVVPALFNAVKALTTPGDGIIIMTPVYYPFYMAIEKTGRKVVENPLTDDGEVFSIDYADLEEKAKQKENTMLILCNPHNPVGRVWKKDELEKIAEICLRHNVLVVSDEIHFDLILKGYEHTVFSTLSKETADNCIVCTSPSKTYNLAGIACCNIIIQNPELRKKFTDEMDRNGTFSQPLLAYKSCELAYTRCEQWYLQFLDLLETNKRLTETFIGEHLPMLKVRELQGTYLIWIDCRALRMNKDELERFMQDKALLFLDEGYIFGGAGEGFERINLACPTKVLEDALHRLKKALVELG